MTRSTTAERLAALEAKTAVLVPESPPDPFESVKTALDNLRVEVEAIPFSGQDQRVRARDTLRRFRHELLSAQLLEA